MTTMPLQSERLAFFPANLRESLRITAHRDVVESETC